MEGQREYGLPAVPKRGARPLRESVVCSVARPTDKVNDGPEGFCILSALWQPFISSPSEVKANQPKKIQRGRDGEQ